MSIGLNILLAVLGPVLLLPLGLWIYVRLHEHLHGGIGKGEWRYFLRGIGWSLPLGLSWTIYVGHHLNHHKFGNGPGDFSGTRDGQGRQVSGSKYLLRQGMYPFFIQLIPFASVAMMQAKRRNVRVYLDEAARVALRVGILLVMGWPALLIWLWWNAAFLNYLMYVNYLQHFDCDAGQAAVWEHPRFNAWFRHFGLHDQHHASPQLAAQEVKAVPGRTPARRSMGMFSPRVFFAFLQSPEQLRRVLA